MITSFFAPKSKAVRGDERTRKRVAEDSRRRGTGDDDDDSRTTKKVATTTPPSESSSHPASASSGRAATPTTNTAEAIALLSLLLPCEEGERRQAAVVARVIPDWRGALEAHFATSSFSSLAKFVARERASHTVYPPPNSIFSALNLTPLSRVKVVIVGQDPYHQPNQGHGLSFSVPHGVTVPPSLRNIYKELLSDANVPEFDSLPRHGNLERWAGQGVLLLNNVLTVRRGEAASHSKRGWEEFTDRVIEAVVRQEGDDDECDGATTTGDDRRAGGEDDERDEGRIGTGVVFLLWGKPASLKATTVLARSGKGGRARHAVITCSHPSPLGATKTSSPFMGSRCFSRANEELVKRGWKPIDWRVDGPLECNVEKSPIMEEWSKNFKGACEDYDV